MCKVNYITEHSSFMKLAIQQELSANEITLYNVLLVYFNSLSSGNEWPQGFIGISNKKLLALLPFSEAMLIKTREKLLSRGLGIFEFVAGNKRSNVPCYKLLYFSAKGKEAKQDGKSVQPISILAEHIKESEKALAENQANVDTCAENEQSICEPVTEDPEIVTERRETVIASEAQAKDDAESIAFIEAGLGCKLTVAQRHTAMLWVKRYDFDKSVYMRAATLSMSKQQPFQYLNKLLFKWDVDGVPEWAPPQKYTSFGETKKVLHQDYEQRQYSNDDYNVWVPDFGDEVATGVFN